MFQTMIEKIKKGSTKTGIYGRLRPKEFLRLQAV